MVVGSIAAARRASRAGWPGSRTGRSPRARCGATPRSTPRTRLTPPAGAPDGARAPPSRGARTRRRPRRRSGRRPDDVGVLGGAPAERLRRVAGDVGGRRTAVDPVLADRDREPGLGAVGVDARRSPTIPEPSASRVAIASVRSSSGVEPVAPDHDDAVGRAGRQRRRLRARLLAPVPRAELVLQRLHLRRAAARPARAARPGATCSASASVAQLHLFVVDARERAVAGDRLDPAQVGADRALAHDLDRADEAERVHVRAAAQLDRVLARLEHAHEVAVLVAEERDRAERSRRAPSWSRSGARARRR